MKRSKIDEIRAVLRTAADIDSRVAGDFTGSARDLQEQTDIARSSVIRQLNALNHAGMAHIHDWHLSTATWVALWARGPGENVPKPVETRDEYNARRREKAKHVKLVREPEEERTPEMALGAIQEFIQQVKACPQPWYAALTVYQPLNQFGVHHA